MRINERRDKEKARRIEEIKYLEFQNNNLKRFFQDVIKNKGN